MLNHQFRLQYLEYAMMQAQKASGLLTSGHCSSSPSSFLDWVRTFRLYFLPGQPLLPPPLIALLRKVSSTLLSQGCTTTLLTVTRSAPHEWNFSCLIILIDLTCFILAARSRQSHSLLLLNLSSFSPPLQLLTSTALRFFLSSPSPFQVFCNTVLQPPYIS